MTGVNRVSRAGAKATVDRLLQIPPIGLAADMAVPAAAKGIVVFAHGSGSSRLSPRNMFVARELQNAGLGTLLFDLLTEAEAEDRNNVFDIPLLADRLLLATNWLTERREVRDLPVAISVRARARRQP